MRRMDVLREIDELIRENCHGCPNRIQRGGFSKADVHCAKECPVGAKLQGCGRMLLASSKDRRNRKSPA